MEFSGLLVRQFCAVYRHHVGTERIQMGQLVQATGQGNPSQGMGGAQGRDHRPLREDESREHDGRHATERLPRKVSRGDRDSRANVCLTRRHT